VDVELARNIAREQLEREAFEELVRREKERLRARRPFWHRLFPFVISIKRRV
jgi:hypothetical protein